MQFLRRRLLQKPQTDSEQGFTLIELITVIVLLGIIGVMGSEIITTTFKGFSETDASMELFEEGKLALMRMEREIHHIVPNAIEIPSTDTINFGLIDVNTLNDNDLAGQYQPIGVTSRIRDLSFNTLPDLTLISIYNTSWSDFTSLDPAIRKIYSTSPIAPNMMQLDKAVIGGHSATMRYYPVRQIIRYSYDGLGTLFRTQATVSTAGDLIAALDAAPARPLLSNITALTFNYTPASLTSNALVRVNFTLANKGITLDFHKEIQVRNVP